MRLSKQEADKARRALRVLHDRGVSVSLYRDAVASIYRNANGSVDVVEVTIGGQWLADEIARLPEEIAND